MSSDPWAIVKRFCEEFDFLLSRCISKNLNNENSNTHAKFLHSQALLPAKLGIATSTVDQQFVSYQHHIGSSFLQKP